MKVCLSFALALPMALTMATTAFSDPIYLTPGQCILLGAQQVCAMPVNQVQTVTVIPTDKPRYEYVCRYGMHAGADIPDLKSYALFQIQVTAVGSKTETMIKTYGAMDRAPCEKDAERRQAEDKR